MRVPLFVKSIGSITKVPPLNELAIVLLAEFVTEPLVKILALLVPPVRVNCPVAPEGLIVTEGVEELPITIEPLGVDIVNAIAGVLIDSDALPAGITLIAPAPANVLLRVTPPVVPDPRVSNGEIRLIGPLASSSPVALPAAA